MVYSEDGESLIAPLVWTIQIINLTSNHCRGIRHICSETETYRPLGPKNFTLERCRNAVSIFIIYGCGVYDKTFLILWIILYSVQKRWRPEAGRWVAEGEYIIITYKNVVVYSSERVSARGTECTTGSTRIFFN